MAAELNWIGTAILFGAIQGLIFSVILLFNRKHPGAAFLSAFMFILAYNGFETFNWVAGINYTFFDVFSFVFIYGLGPSLYLYVYSLLNPEREITRSAILWSYSPLFIQFVLKLFLVIIYVLNANQLIAAEQLVSVLMQVFFAYAEPLSILIFLIYLYFSFRALKISKRWGKILLIKRDAQKEVYRWVNGLLYAMLVLGMAWPLAVLALPFFFSFEQDAYYLPIEIGLVIFIYWIAFAGYLRIKMIYKRTDSPDISEDKAAALLSRLKKLMENEKLYLRQDLNREFVAEKLGITSKRLSTLLNQHASKSFNDFINAYRIQEFAERVISTDYKHLTMTSIAFDSGFNSQPTFQRAFKNIKGMSPREFFNRNTTKTP